MRQIGTISDEKLAQRLADYLLTQRIETKLDAKPDGWEVWVCDEDRVAQAKVELAAFTTNPDDPSFVRAAVAAADIRHAEERTDEDYRRRQVDLGERMRNLGSRAPRITILLIAACVTVAGLTNLGRDNRELMQKLYIAPFQPVEGTSLVRTPELRPIREGEVWRLVTPIFLHFGIEHLVFDMLALYYFGALIEARRGSLRFLGLVAVAAVISNLCEYWLGGMRWEGGQRIDTFSGAFGGMSGVDFALFGYIWMKMRFEPDLGLSLSRQTFVVSLIWLAFCLTGLAGPIANVAHISGLLVGVAVGIAPVGWRAFFKRLSRP